MQFEEAVAIIIKEEGGSKITQDPDDPGGLTKFGISQKAYPHLDIRNLTLEDAKAIYHDDYWDEVKGDELPDNLRLIVFDSAVNQGVAAAIGMLQAALGVKVDAKLGPKTLEAAHKVDQYTLFKVFAKNRLLRYGKSPKWGKYGEGWATRLNLMMFKTFEDILRS